MLQFGECAHLFTFAEGCGAAEGKGGVFQALCSGSAQSPLEVLTVWTVGPRSRFRGVIQTPPIKTAATFTDRPPRAAPDKPYCGHITEPRGECYAGETRDTQKTRGLGSKYRVVPTGWSWLTAPLDSQPLRKSRPQEPALSQPLLFLGLYSLYILMSL